MRRHLAGSLVIATLSFGANAEDQDSGAYLLRTCTPLIRLLDGARDLSVAQTHDAAQCTGYISGFVDGATIINELSEANLLCLPAGGITVDQAVRLVVKYLRTNPDKLHQSARVSLLVAIRQVFACNSKK